MLQGDTGHDVTGPDITPLLSSASHHRPSSHRQNWASHFAQKHDGWGVNGNCAEGQRNIGGKFHRCRRRIKPTSLAPNQEGMTPTEPDLAGGRGHDGSGAARGGFGLPAARSGGADDPVQKAEESPIGQPRRSALMRRRHGVAQPRMVGQCGLWRRRRGAHAVVAGEGTVWQKAREQSTMRLAEDEDDGMGDDRGADALGAGVSTTIRGRHSWAQQAASSRCVDSRRGRW